MKISSFFVLAAAFIFPASALATEDPPPLRPTLITASASSSPEINYLVQVDPQLRAITVLCNGKQVADGLLTEFPEENSYLEGSIVGTSIMIPTGTPTTECSKDVSVALYVNGSNNHGVMLATEWFVDFEDGSFIGLLGGIKPDDNFRIVERRDNRDRCVFSTVKRGDCRDSGRGMRSTGPDAGVTAQ